MKKIFTKPKYIRSTTDNKWVLVYVLTAFLAGMLTVGALWRFTDYFKSVKRGQPLISPLEGIESLVIRPVYAAEIKREESRWYRLYQTIRNYESNYGTQGLAVTCKRKGMVNEIGWLPVKGYCFKSLSQQESTIAKRLTTQINQGWSDAKILCYHNLGKIVSSCHYSDGNLSKAN